MKLAEAEKKRQAAELNLDALKSQTRVRDCWQHRQTLLLSFHKHEMQCLNSSHPVQGLENEYDRLLATNDALQKKLSKLQPGSSEPSSKKEW